MLNTLNTMEPFQILLGIVFAGLIGTCAMTLAMYLYAYFSKKFTKVIHILANMLVGETNYHFPSTNAFIVGSIGHFGIGLIFSCSYYFLWNVGYIKLNFITSLVIGFLSGCLAIGVWKGYLELHSSPPRVSQKDFFLALIISHVILGIVTTAVLKWIF